MGINSYASEFDLVTFFVNNIIKKICQTCWLEDVTRSDFSKLRPSELCLGCSRRCTYVSARSPQDVWNNGLTVLTMNIKHRIAGLHRSTEPANCCVLQNASTQWQHWQWGKTPPNKCPHDISKSCKSICDENALPSRNHRPILALKYPYSHCDH